MEMMRCPQCGTEFEKGSTEFCPNPNCGFPVAFAQDPITEPVAVAMERKPGEVVRPAPPPPLAAQPPTPPPAKPRKKLPVAVIAGIAAAVVVIGVVLFLVLKPSHKVTLPSGNPSHTPSVSHKPPPHTPPTPTPLVDHLAAMTWNRVPGSTTVFGGNGDQVMNRVSAGGAGVVAVGSDSSIGNQDAAAWTSRDGTAWTRVASSSFSGAGDQEISGVAPNGSSVVGVGWDGSGGNFDAAVWQSNGVTWSRVAPDPTTFGGPGNQVMNRVARGGPGFVAVGFSTTADGSTNGAVWTSKDGAAWSRAPDDPTVFGGAGDQRIRGVTAFNSGLVAVGFDTGNGSKDAAVWTSDGVTWSRVPADPAVFGSVTNPGSNQEMVSVTQFGSELVAVGQDGSLGDSDGDKDDDSDAAIWTSKDGLHWTRVTPDPAVFGGPGEQALSGVVATKSGLVAVGYDESSGSFDGAVWTSPDAIHWKKTSNQFVFGGPDDQRMKSVDIAGGFVVAVGWSGKPGSLDAAVWRAKLP